MIAALVIVLFAYLATNAMILAAMASTHFAMGAALNSSDPNVKGQAVAYFHQIEVMRRQRLEFVLRLVFCPWTLLGKGKLSD